MQNLNSRRLPAEWETDCAIMLAWPHAATDWVYMLDDVQRCYIELAHAIADSHPLLIVAPDVSEPERALTGINRRRMLLFETPTNDTWVRDYGPVTVEDASGYTVVDFAFNGWGLKFAADRDNMVTSAMYRARLLGPRYDNRLGFVLEGGSIESDGRGTLLTTSRCLLSPNRNGDMTRMEIEQYLAGALGADRILWLDHGYLAGDDTDSHVDTLARLAPDDTIVYVKCDNPDDEHHAGLEAMECQLKSFTTRDGKPYNLVALPMPDAIYDSDGARLPATYANYLVTPDSLFMPSYNQPANDDKARRILQAMFPGRHIVQVDCRALIRQHGSLHCATMQIPKTILPL